MTRAEIRDFIESGINDLSAAVGFGSGRITEFNKDRSNTYPFAWLESLKNSPDRTDQNLLIDNYQVVIHVAKKDAQDSSAAIYEDIIDDCDEIAKQLLIKYNQIVSGYKLVTINSINIDPFIKKHADILTGVILSFTLNVPDVTNRC